MEKLLAKQSLPQWVKKITAYSVYAPVKQGDIWNYTALNESAEIDLEYLNTILSAKSLIFPQREVFLEFFLPDRQNLEIKEELPADSPVVIFGVRPCDARALTLLDQVFGGDFEDPYYWKRRKQTVLVGLGCSQPPSPNCFCTSVNGSPFSTEGLDILMTDLGDSYFVESLTAKGEELINAAGGAFQESDAGQSKKAAEIKESAPKKIKREIRDVGQISAKLKGMFESTFWDKESLSCIRCGICTYLCPTCHCFDINDEVVSTVPLKGKRVRTWDTCQFPDFTMHSSGHNPRPNRSSRLRQRILHKFQYGIERYDQFLCTGCGRCVSQCPVGIDIIEILNKVRDYGS
jgi:sulfhydrogenase subunit beta (sulfur reductase)